MSPHSLSLSFLSPLLSGKLVATRLFLSESEPRSMAGTEMMREKWILEERQDRLLRIVTTPLSSQDCRAQRLSRLLSGAGRKLGDAFPPLPLSFSNLSLRRFYFAASLPPPRCLSLPRVSPSLSSNVELFERSDPLPARRSMLVNPRISNSSFALAAERTRRKDPLDSYNYYTGGWNISNIHYGAVRWKKLEIYFG